MAKTNLTLYVEERVKHAAEVIARARGVSVSRLFEELVENLVKTSPELQKLVEAYIEVKNG